MFIPDPTKQLPRPIREYFKSDEEVACYLLWKCGCGSYGQKIYKLAIGTSPSVRFSVRL